MIRIDPNAGRIVAELLAQSVANEFQDRGLTRATRADDAVQPIGQLDDLAIEKAAYD